MPRTPKPKALLPFASYSGGDPEYEFNESLWQSLEHAYSCKIPEDARAPLVTAANRFLYARRLELERKSYEDVEALFPPFDDAAKALCAVAYGPPDGDHSDAAAALESVMERAMRDQPLLFNPHESLLFITADTAGGWEKFADRNELPDGAYAVKLDMALLGELAMVFSVSLNKAKQEIKQHIDDGAKRRPTAEARFINVLVDWAGTYGLPISHYANGMPTPFSRFVRTLLAAAPEALREKILLLTDTAVAERIRKAKERHLDQERELKRASTNGE